jgi:hypothetical protein
VGLYIPIDSVQLVVEAAGVAHGLALVVAPPQRGVTRTAVGAALPVAPCRRLQRATKSVKRPLSLLTQFSFPKESLLPQIFQAGTSI